MIIVLLLILPLSFTFIVFSIKLGDQQFSFAFIQSIFNNKFKLKTTI